MRATSGRLVIVRSVATAARTTRTRPMLGADKRDFYQQANDNMLVGALLEDQGSIDNIDDILAVDGIHYFGIGMNDFAQGIGYPGECEHPDVVKAANELSDYIRSKGRYMNADIMSSVWIHELLLNSAQQFMDENAS